MLRFKMVDFTTKAVNAYFHSIVTIYEGVVAES